MTPKAYGPTQVQHIAQILRDEVATRVDAETYEAIVDAVRDEIVKHTRAGDVLALRASFAHIAFH